MAPHLTYSVWKNDNMPFLANLAGNEIILTYSGGKDSSVALHFMIEAAKEFGFKFETRAGVFPHHVLTQPERFRFDAYWRNRGVSIIWHEVHGSDDQLQQAIDNGVNPCLACNQVKKSALMQYFTQEGYDWKKLVLIMSYSLWDLVSATVEHVLGYVYADLDAKASLRGKAPTERFLETSQRFFPWLRLESGLQVFKPLIRYNDQKILDIIAENSIPVTAIPCKYKKFRPKRLFAQYYEDVNLQFDYDKVFAFAKANLGLPDISYFESRQLTNYLKEIL